MKIKKLKKINMGLRQRWLLHASVIVCVLGILCVTLIAAGFSSQLYRAEEDKLLKRAQVANDFFTDRVNKNETEYFEACMIYPQGCNMKGLLDVQFVDVTGKVLSSQSGQWDGQILDTPEIEKAVKSRGSNSYIGKLTQENNRIMALSEPMIASSGTVIGVLRFVSDTGALDKQILSVVFASLFVVLVMIVAVLLSINYYADSILKPISQIAEKARMISGGSYGIQIQTKYDDEIGELADAINEMSMKINQNEKTQTEFISSLSHELRTPLTAITGWSETLLHTEGLDESTRRGMKIIHREAGRLTEMVLSLLDFTRIQDGRMTLNIEPTDLRSEFEDTVFMYGSRLEADGIHLEYVENEDDIPEVLCDPQRMRQVFLNILDNATKHGGEGKRIDAEICCTEDAVLIRIRDYGPGIAEDEIPLVKKKFYKGSSKARGSGIGLAVCDEIVEMHGGQLILENATDGGTLVTVQLPVSQ